MTLSQPTARGENPALSYRNMRAIIGYVGLMLPAVLLISGLIDGHLQGSISAYYYTKVGNVFTGSLCVVGIFLIAYRLMALTLDNVATSLAGIAAIGVAMFHSAPVHATVGQLRLADVHLTCAAVLFVLLGGISLFIFPSTDVDEGEKWRCNWYRGFGALIWLAIALMPTLNAFASSFYNDNRIFFWLETICVMSFAASFIFKGHGQPSSRAADKAANVDHRPAVQLAA